MQPLLRGRENLLRGLKFQNAPSKFEKHDREDSDDALEAAEEQAARSRGSSERDASLLNRQIAKGWGFMTTKKGSSTPVKAEDEDGDAVMEQPPEPIVQSDGTVTSRMQYN